MATIAVFFHSFTPTTFTGSRSLWFSWAWNPWKRGKRAERFLPTLENLFLIFCQLPNKIEDHPCAHAAHNHDQQNEDDDHMGGCEVERNRRFSSFACFFVPSKLTVPHSVADKVPSYAGSVVTIIFLFRTLLDA